MGSSSVRGIEDEHQLTTHACGAAGQEECTLIKSGATDYTDASCPQ